MRCWYWLFNILSLLVNKIFYYGICFSSGNSLWRKDERRYVASSETLLHMSPSQQSTKQPDVPAKLHTVKKGRISIRCNDFKETQIIINFTRVRNISCWAGFGKGRLKCIWSEKYFLLIWKSFQNTEDWRFSFWNIFFRFRDINVFLLCKLDQWWRHIVCSKKL